MEKADYVLGQIGAVCIDIDRELQTRIFSEYFFVYVTCLYIDTDKIILRSYILVLHCYVLIIYN